MPIKSLDDVEREKRIEGVTKVIEDVGSGIEDGIGKILTKLRTEKEKRDELLKVEKKKFKNRLFRFVLWLLFIVWMVIFGLGTYWLLRWLVKGVFGL